MQMHLQLLNDHKILPTLPRGVASLCALSCLSFALLFASNTSRANEWVRPETLKDYANLAGVTAEKAIQVQGTEVAWANYGAIRRDFAELNGLSNDQIDQWLIQNFSYIGAAQPELDLIRNSPIPLGTRKKAALRTAQKPDGASRRGGKKKQAGQGWPAAKRQDAPKTWMVLERLGGGVVGTAL